MTEEAIFAEALEKTAELRAAYLDDACRDDADLRDRVERLLLAYEESESFLESPAVPLDPTAEYDPRKSTVEMAPNRPIAEGEGTKIGPYKLLQQIGEGGMGTVFLAEQEKPVRRRVALKIIKPGMDSAQVVARFEAERQALALMDHQNIARVLDAGATDTGRPFFVMELVKGVPITEYCDRNHLTLKERLELFVPVCQAIQHAHQKGIIHRDIKPSNVMITLYDGKAVPKVIDFGVAKAIEQKLTERTMFTEFGAVIGTLEYMSPEQAEMGALDIDTRSDIYSLGVVLYELLTGSTPLERGKLRRAAYDEVLRRIREEEPTKPSTRLSESKDALPTISAQRKMEPARLTRLVRGELDWIVMKALEKDRTRRYETATGFARDIQRYLEGDPVEACPPSRTYRLSKFASKHRAALATVGAFAVLLVAATAVSAGLAYWANRQRVRAVTAENAAKGQTLLADQQKGRALDRERMAIEAVNRFGEVVGDTLELKSTASLAPLRTKLLKEPQAFFKELRDRLQDDRETSPDSLARLAKVSFDLGMITDEIGDKPDAILAYEQALAIHERIARENPSNANFQESLARNYNNLGLLRRDTGRTVEAMAMLEKARALWEQLVRLHPLEVRYQNGLASCRGNIGNLHYAMGRPAEALASLEQCRDLWKRIAQAHSPNIEGQEGLARVLSTIGVLHRELGRPAEAMAAYEQAREIQERLAREGPSVGWHRDDLALTLANIGRLHIETGRPLPAMTSLEKARAIQEPLARDNPAILRFQATLAIIYAGLGHVRRGMGRPAEASASYQQAMAIQERLVRENPANIRFRTEMSETLGFIGLIQMQTGQPDEAMATFEKAVATLEPVAREHPETPDFAGNLGGYFHNMALIDKRGQRFEPARDKLRKAIEWQRKALALIPNHPKCRELLGNHLESLITTDQVLGHAEEAEEALRELAELRKTDPRLQRDDARLAAVLQGQPPRDDAERVRLAIQAYEQARYATAARLFAEALANDPRLAIDRQAQNRYNAACAASLASCGRAKDEPPPDDATRVKLRNQAREWLQAELTLWAKVLETAPAPTKAAIVPILDHWKKDADLAGIRDQAELAKLPEAEQAAFQQLWTNLDQLRTKAASGKPADPPR